MKQLLFLCFILPQLSWGQIENVQLIEGSDIRDKKVNFKGFVGEKDDLIYALVGKDWEGLTLLAYDKATMEVEKEIQVEEVKDPVYVPGILSGDNVFIRDKGIHIIRYGYEKKIKSIGLFHRIINWDGSSSEYERIFTVESLAGFSVTKDDLIIEVSPDESKIMVYSFPFRPSTKRPVQVVIFDKDFEELYRTSLASPFERALSFVPTQVAVDNEGGAYILGFRKRKTKDENEKDPQDEITERYGVFKVDKSGVESVLDFAEEGMIFHDLYLSVHDAGVDMIGLFLKEPKTFESENVFMHLDYNLNIKSMVTSKLGQNMLDYFDFDPRTKEKYKYGGKRKSTLKGLLRFRYKDLVRWPDGTYTAMAERVVGPAQGFGYAFDEIIMLNLDVSGKIKNGEVIDVNQQERTAFSSYVAHQGKDKVYILFNDHEKNIERRILGEEPYGLYIKGGYMSKAITMVAGFSKSGEIEYKNIRTFSERYSLVWPSCYLNMGKEEAAFYFAPENTNNPGGEHIVRVRF